MVSLHAQTWEDDMIGTSELQRLLAAKNFYKGSIDGVLGKQTYAACIAALAASGVDASGWLVHRVLVGGTQWALKEAGFDPGPLDGWDGATTQVALERWQNASRDIVVTAAVGGSQWPRQADMKKFYGAPGTNHTVLELPYPMRLAWDLNTTVSRITINKHCAESAGRIFSKTLQHYGYARLVGLNLDRFGGCYANRPMRGGKKLSTHAFACALDIDPDHNQLRWGSDRAALARPECEAFLDICEEEGWVSLGRERNFDWMHIQAARL